MHVLSRLLTVLCLAALPALAPLSAALEDSGDHAGARSGTTQRHEAVSWKKEVAFRVTDQLSAHTQAALFPSQDVALSVTHRLWAGTPRERGAAGRQELARLRLSQQLNLFGQQEHAFQPLASNPLWADLLLEARMAPVAGLQLSSTATYDPAGAQWTLVSSKLTLQPLSVWTLSLASDFAHGSALEGLHGGMQLTLPGTWSGAYALSSPALGLTAASHTVTARYHSSFGYVDLHLVQTPEEMCVSILMDVTTFLRHRLDF